MLGSNSLREPLLSETNPIQEPSALDLLRRQKAQKLRADLVYQEDVLNGEQTQTLFEATVLPKKSWKETIKAFPRYAFKEVAGWLGGFGAVTGVGLVAWRLGSTYYLNQIAKPAAILLVSSTFPGAIVPADLIAYAITSPDVLSMAFTSLVMFNKSVAGKYYKDGKEAFLDGWRKRVGIDKKAPADAKTLSRKAILWQVLDKTGEALSIFPGAATLFVGVVSVRAVSMAVLRFANNMPIVGPASSIVADLYGAALFTAMTLLGKELPETVAKWGSEFARNRADDVMDAGNAAVEKAGNVVSAVFNTGAHAAYSAASGAHRAGSRAVSPLFDLARRQQSSVLASNATGAPVIRPVVINAETVRVENPESVTIKQEHADVPARARSASPSLSSM